MIKMNLNEENPIEEKSKKSVNIKKFLPYIVLVGAVFMIIYACNLDKFFTKEPVNLKQLIESSFYGENIEGKYAGLEIDLLTEYFAEYEDSYEKEIFHVARDKDDFMYVVSFSEEDSESFKNMIEYTNGKIEEKPASVLVKGVVEKLPDSLNKILKDSFELNSDEELVDYFGTLYSLLISI